MTRRSLMASMVGGLDFASTADHLRARRWRIGSAVAGQVVAAGPSTLPPVAGPGGGRPGRRWAGGAGRGGVHRVAVPESHIRTAATRSWLSGDTVELTVAARQRIGTAYSMIHAIDTHAQPLKKELTRFGERQPACRALVAAHYGIGGLLATAI